MDLEEIARTVSWNSEARERDRENRYSVLSYLFKSLHSFLRAVKKKMFLRVGWCQGNDKNSNTTQSSINYCWEFHNKT